MKGRLCVLAAGCAMLALSAAGRQEHTVANPDRRKSSSAPRPGVASTAPAKWAAVEAIKLKGLEVGLSQPVLVARRRGYLWFPTLTKLPDGRLMAQMSAYADKHVKTTRSLVCWSDDGGLTWTKPVAGQYGEVALAIPSGDTLLLPYYLRRVGEDVLGAAYEVCPKGKREVRLTEPGVRVGGWPRPDRSFAPGLGLAGFVFNGQTVRLKGGGYLATLYGYFEGAKRYSLVAAESRDGVNWKVRSVVADEKCKLRGGEGPCESAIARLKDGRIMCVFRLAGGAPYGQTFSSDDGKSWTPPVAMRGPHSVQPSLAVMKDGTVALSGGRPGLFLWINADGTGRSWQEVDVRRHHNARDDEKIVRHDHTSSYTEVVALDARHLLYIYDRIPRGWSAIPTGSNETNSVRVIRVTVKKPSSKAASRP